MKDNCRLQAPTGAGKTVIFAALIGRWMKAYPGMRVMVLAHRQELVDQAFRKLMEGYPELFPKARKACSGLGRVVVDNQVTIGTYQTVVRREIKRPVSLLIVDEAHRLPTKRRQSDYRKLIGRLKMMRPTMRLLGVTATPWRMASGFIYGGAENWFERLDHSIGMLELIEGGFLVPIRLKVNVETGLAEELAQVSRSRGEYQTGELSDAMSQKAFIESAVRAWREYGEDRRAAVIFAVSIQHAQLLESCFLRAGLAAGTIHSRMPQQDRREALAKFECGETEFLINVGILTEGWDSPKVNLIMMARPTLSPGLYVQMIGRGARLHEGKKDLLVLDLVNNSEVHGVPWDPFVKEGKGDRQPHKICPKCGLLITDRAVKVCPDCQYKFPEREVPAPKPLVDVGPASLREFDDGGREARVYAWDAFFYVSKAGNEMLKFTLDTSLGKINEYLDFDANGSAWGQKRARVWWRARARGGALGPPETCEEAKARCHELFIPEKVTIRKDKGFWKVLRWS
jgi:DNA repair protein RadD